MSAMKLLTDSAMISFGTLLSPGLAHLGQLTSGAEPLKSVSTHASQASIVPDTVWRGQSPGRSPSADGMA
jgi:hypothetical protein